MFINNKKPNPHFHAYYQDNGLLIQFVIAELIATHQLAHELKLLGDKHLDSIQSFAEGLKPLSRQLSLLLGAHTENERPFNSHWIGGPLNKLKSYCFQFSKNAQQLNKSGISLYTHVHQAWFSAMRNLELLSSLQHSSMVQINATTLLVVKRKLNHFYNHINHIYKQLPRVINSFLDNENVIFFLFRKRKQLSEVYGADFINKLFINSAKKQAIINFVTQKYVNRGFDHLIDSINHK